MFFTGGAVGARRLVRRWRREVRGALHCLLATREGALLADTIDMWADLALARVDLAG